MSHDRLSCFLAALILLVAMAVQPSQAASERAVFAGGCFWCMHAAFEQLPGVTQVTSGYTGGAGADPTYEQVSTGETGHVEAIEVAYDPDKVAYGKLLEWFWDNVDPTDAAGQFCDKGRQYAAGIFYTSPAQKTAATESQARVEKRLQRSVTTFIKPAGPFYAAEDYHQSYYAKNKLRYRLYKAGCGRERRLKDIWQKP